LLGRFYWLQIGKQSNSGSLNFKYFLTYLHVGGYMDMKTSLSFCDGGPLVMPRSQRFEGGGGFENCGFGESSAKAAPVLVGSLPFALLGSDQGN
jgi:hypothetical protein